MKKIIIISYFFPPSNFVGGFRVDYWARNLSKYGYKPIVITRQWNDEQSEITDRIIHNNFVHEVNDDYEVYRIPYKRSVRDKLSDYSRFKPLVYFRKFLSILELVFSNFWLRYIPYNSLYFFARKLLEKDSFGYHCVILSGRPFQQFFFGYRLAKEYGVKWIADYRDEWNTHQSRNPTTWLEKIIYQLEMKSELKWTKNCATFLCVSDLWVESIENFIGKKGFTIKNGYDPKDYVFLEEKRLSVNDFVITYSGTLYATQNFDLFLGAFKRVVKEYSMKINLKVNMFGVTIMPEQSKRFKKLIIGFEKYFDLTSRIPKTEVIEHQYNSDLLLTTAYAQVTGCYPVKIFEYYACRTPVLLCPSDGDVIEEFLMKSGCGLLAETEDECYLILKDLVERKLKGERLIMKRNEGFALQFTRENQTKLLADILDNHI